MRTLLILGFGPLQIAALRTAKAKGLRVIVATSEPSVAAHALADDTFAISPHDTQGISALAARERIDGVLSVCAGDYARAVATVCESLELPGLRRAAAAKITHKGNLRDLLAAAGVPLPRYRRAFDREEVYDAAADLGLPVTLQAATARGPRLVRDEDELARAYDRINALAAEANEIVVSKWHEGPEANVETLSYGGQHHIIAITDEVVRADRPWLPVAHITPSRLPGVAQTQLRVTTLAGLDATGIMDCAAHVRLKLTHKGPRVVDIEACPSDGYVATELIPRALGIDLIGAAIDIALDDIPRHKRDRYGAAAARYLHMKAGTITALSGLEEARRAEGIAAVELFIKAGDTIAAAHEAHGLSGYIIAEDDEPAGAEQRAARAAACLRVVTDGLEFSPS